MKTTNTKSAKRKLLPAVAMLTTSAIMLSTATYAWFTMSKEVSVTGINLTATVPSNLEISFGTVSGVTAAVAPAETNTAPGWSNTIAFGGTYKTTGKLIPSSSINGQKIFYTKDAVADGKTVSTTAEYVEATSGAKISGTDNDTANVSDGYYIDIPVWFRTSSPKDTTENVSLSVKADITAGTDSPDLFKSVRVAILNTDSTQETSGVVTPIGYKYDNDKHTAVAGSDFAVNKADTLSDTVDFDDIYEAVDKIVQSDGTATTKGDTVVTVAKNDTTDKTYNYGAAKKMIVRVWIEGEDDACYNPNAGQNFNIALTFYDKDQLV